MFPSKFLQFPSILTHFHAANEKIQNGGRDLAISRGLVWVKSSVLYTAKNVKIPFYPWLRYRDHCLGQCHQSRRVLWVVAIETVHFLWRNHRQIRLQNHMWSLLMLNWMKALIKCARQIHVSKIHKHWNEYRSFYQLCHGKTNFKRATRYWHCWLLG